MQLLSTIWFSYGSLSLFLTILLMFLLQNRKIFSYSFYRLVQLDLLINAICWIHTWPNRLKFSPDSVIYVLPIYEKAKFLANYLDFAGPLFFHLQSMSTITICAHRLTTAVWESSNSFWDKFYWIIYSGLVLLAFIVTSSFWLIEWHVYYFDYLTQTFVMVDLTHAAIQICFLMSFMTGYILIILVLGVCTVYHVRKRLDHHADHYKQIIRRISVIAAVKTAVNLLALLWHLTLMYLPFSYHYEMMMCVSDVMSFSMTFLLLGLDTNVRTVMKSLTKKNFEFLTMNRVVSSTRGPVVIVNNNVT